MKSLKLCAWVVASLFVFTLAACGGGGGSSSSGTGTLSLMLTDIPADACYCNVYVTIAEVWIHKAGEGDGEGEWLGPYYPIPDMPVDLNDLRDGVLTELLNIDLKTGRYTQVRLMIGDGADANYLVVCDECDDCELEPTGCEEHDMKIPSGVQTGIKLVHHFTIVQGVTAEIVLDFDAQQSVVWADNSGQYLLKPTIKVIDTRDNAMVSGTVAEEGTESPIGGARVTAQTYNASAADEKDKVVIESATPTGEDGHYTMYVAPGTYCFVAYAYVPNPTDNYGVAYGPGCELLGPFALGGDYTGEDLDLTRHDTGNVTGTVQTGGNDVTLSFRTEGCVPATCEQIEVLSLTVPAVPDPYTPVNYTVGLPEGEYDVVAFTDCETADTLVADVTAHTEKTLGQFEFSFSPCTP